MRNVPKIKDDILIGILNLLDSIFKVRPLLKKHFGSGAK